MLGRQRCGLNRWRCFLCLKTPKALLHQVFGINFHPITGDPVCDEHFRNYIVELDDATKILHDPVTGTPLNFGDMPIGTFLEAREHIDKGEIFKILDMK